MVHRRLSAEYAEDAKQFGRAVRAAREARGWSLDTLVARTGHEINKKTLVRVEQGHTGDDVASPANPELRVLLAISKALDAQVVIDFNRPSGFVIQLIAEGHG